MKQEGRMRLKIHFSNRLKGFLCYVFCFSIPLIWLWIGVRYVYPYRLTGTAPDVSLFINNRLSVLGSAFDAFFQKTGLLEGITEASIRLVVKDDLYWLGYFSLLVIAAWILTLAMQLIWRACSAVPWNTAKATQRAVIRFRVMEILVAAFNVVLAVFLWQTGVCAITGKVFWDYTMYFGPFLFNMLAYIITSRLVAPAVISGKNAFFKRL